jgi:oxalate decarboxylase
MPSIEESALYVSPYKYKIESASPLISTTGGNVRVARQDTWPILKNQSLYSLVISNEGMREPHWHPETAELGYVNKGRIRMSILTPKGDVDTYEIGEGDIYFIPKAYPHHIENMSDEASHLLVFFDQALPKDIGFSASVKSFSNELLTAGLNCPEGLFPSLPNYYSDLLIVERVNSLDLP